MNRNRVCSSFWKGKRVLLTGHTGFKGAWAAAWLTKLGAEVTGIALAPEQDHSLIRCLEEQLNIQSHILDIRDASKLDKIVKKAKPEVVLHMAAQALVRRSYQFPLETYETNVTGTLNLLLSLRETENLKAVLVVTSDKVYQNNEEGRPFVETDILGGDDPYSSSKAACEIATASMAKSYYADKSIRIATARAGNVIGGGDFSEDRLIPDIWRAANKGDAVTLRYPDATRPWQHVLESISGYLIYLEALFADEDNALPTALNFGPAEQEVLTVGEIAFNVQKAFGINSDWQRVKSGEKLLAEKAHLALDASLAEKVLGWKATWNSRETLEKTVDWYRRYSQGDDMKTVTDRQIEEFEGSLDD
ncbi:MAG: CDP-glucose 4,6-dehydratase [Sneathiellales bacterium]|nr:CDP-glucose 4,6-dehydratase [Sneathiellales bacterium]